MTTQEKIAELNPDTFEDTYKKSYSHGLESIYALEVVDPNSIRPMVQATEEEAPIQSQISQEQEDGELQLEMDFGSHYRTWIKPFFLEEPIQVLNLSILAEKALLENGIEVISELLGNTIQGLAQLKGLGQGHLDEIQQSLSEYIDGRSAEQTRHIDFMGWVRSLIGKEDRKKAKVAVEPYGLDQCIQLTPSEEMEVKRLKLETRREWIEEVYGRLSDQKLTDKIREDFRALVDVFIKPWMWGRQGIAIERELRERLERVAEQETYAMPALNFIESVFFSDEYLFDLNLSSVDDGVYCSDSSSAKMYRDVISKAKSYYYMPQAYYGLDELVTLLQREYSAKWQRIPEGFIERALRLTPHFRVRKGEEGKLVVRLA